MIKNFFYSVKEKLVEGDQVMSPSYTKFHYEDDKDQKTVLGGLLTFLIKVYVV